MYERDNLSCCFYLLMVYGSLVHSCIRCTGRGVGWGRDSGTSTKFGILRVDSSRILDIYSCIHQCKNRWVHLEMYESNNSSCLFHFWVVFTDWWSMDHSFHLIISCAGREMGWGRVWRSRGGILGSWRKLGYRGLIILNSWYLFLAFINARIDECSERCMRAIFRVACFFFELF